MCIMKRLGILNVVYECIILLCIVYEFKFFLKLIKYYSEWEMWYLFWWYYGNILYES